MSFGDELFLTSSNESATPLTVESIMAAVKKMEESLGPPKPPPAIVIEWEKWADMCLGLRREKPSAFSPVLLGAPLRVVESHDELVDAVAQLRKAGYEVFIIRKDEDENT